LGRLGIEVSSVRYKRDIHDMGDVSDRLMKLRPMTFRYKEDPEGRLQDGLVAEGSSAGLPRTGDVRRGWETAVGGLPTVPAMLLNEIQKQVRENRRKDAQIAALRKQVESLQKETARIEVLARLCALELVMVTKRLAVAMLAALAFGAAGCLPLMVGSLGYEGYE
jgi:hypothetical protein